MNDRTLPPRSDQETLIAASDPAEFYRMSHRVLWRLLDECEANGFSHAAGAIRGALRPRRGERRG